MTIKIIMINGPLRSGKDTCGKLIKKITKGEAQVFCTIDPVKSAIHTLFDCDPDPNFFEMTKGYQNEELFRRVPREVYISLTERWLKQEFGTDILGRLLWRKISRYASEGSGLFCIPGVGQGPEVRVIRSHIRAEHICLIHLYRGQTSFNGDTRSYIEIDGVTPVRLENYGSVRDLERKLTTIVADFLQFVE